jgi:4-diphosphocytidyl-2-C-methyl-D-erythritol kinase
MRMPARLTVLCPAKINLFLSVGPPDSRGYHPLRTIFQSVGLFDELEIDLDVDDFSITSDWPELPERNTLDRTLRLLREIVNLPPMKIHLVKRIPAESGLGGGSSDAGGLLRAVQALMPGHLRSNELHAVAQAVGMDVPYFLVGGRARGEGYGQQVSPLPDGPAHHYVLARPGIGCATAGMFGRLDEVDRPWLEFPEDDRLHNDFERVAPCESLELTERLQVYGAKDAALTGSGSAVFGRYSSEPEAEEAVFRLRDEMPDVWCVSASQMTRSDFLKSVRET